MNVLIFGATGMLGQGVLRECLRDPDVRRVIVVGRSATGRHHEKLHEIVQPDVTDLSRLDPELRDVQACFFCLGVSSAGMTEDRYTHLTYELTMSVARQLARINQDMTFVYVTGAGTDRTGQGRSMWARVKGRTENALLALPFRAAYMFRPGLVQAGEGIRSKTRLYRVLYVVMAPLVGLLRRLFPNQVTTTEEIGRAMIAVARTGYEKRILESPDIRAAAGSRYP